jgi:uncharacterized membrane protein
LAGSSKKEGDDILSDNILRIADELVSQVDKTKKIVMIMVVAVIVGVPFSWHVTPLLLGSPYNFRAAGIVTIVIALVFVAVAVNQWMAFSKWTERYKAYKELQKRVDEKLDFEGPATEKAGDREQSSN